ncbi:oxidoreductase, putative [Acanthamoeba castellanii str. Neff]|uniref:Oxidoreductase, putative n=1 Tax=Acanthamoeba castellanii (strain ATCC 30010 / Neff) TaxID=1257118 RepID=L8HB23_ACACF|nr:oxidoreductase, putative [Acanthamoeba castellanii str. Neff]ELR21933.1 oxidoreductase, putative [Acanthamoeba castellanii str. Neff]
MNKSATAEQSSIDKPLAQLDDYRLLGASGLRVSPLCLGAMTFGTEWQWGAGFEESKRMFDYYVEKGGNFIDTANIYTNGTSEQYVGELVAPLRSQMVVATKYSINAPPIPGLPASSTTAKNANQGGNHRKALVQGLDESLKRMKLDYVDVLYVHVWDLRTPIDETMRALDDVVRSGKALYVAVSDTPAWVISAANNTAHLRGWSPYIGLQTRYNLLDRSLEWELGPMAKANDIGIIPWGALAEGFLTGKHKKGQPTDTKRGEFLERHFSEERNWKIVDEVVAVAKEIDRPAAQVALNWLAQKPGVTSPLVGARTLDQLKENIAALEFTLSPDHMQRLDQVSERPIAQQPFPRNFIATMDMTVGSTKVDRRYAV